MQTLRTILLLASTISTGLLAGVYYSYAMSVMPALNRVDERGAVDVMQRINVVIVNPVFMLSFLGAPIVAAVVAGFLFGKDMRSVLVWVAVAVALNILGTIVTFAFNIPLNDKIVAAGDPASIADPTKVWSDFTTSWANWNIVRGLMHTAAFGCLTWALVQYGRVRS
jgi:uncharacterized membrane protein